jgi:hypothetical protein
MFKYNQVSMSHILSMKIIELYESAKYNFESIPITSLKQNSIGIFYFNTELLKSVYLLYPIKNFKEKVEFLKECIRWSSIFIKNEKKGLTVGYPEFHHLLAQEFFRGIKII